MTRHKRLRAQRLERHSNPGFVGHGEVTEVPLRFQTPGGLQTPGVWISDTRYHHGIIRGILAASWASQGPGIPRQRALAPALNLLLKVEQSPDLNRFLLPGGRDRQRRRARLTPPAAPPPP